jgi:hypothetical protein
MERAAYEAADADAINAHLYRHSKDLPPAAVLSDYRQADQRVLDAIARLTDEDLRRPYSHYQPDEPPYNPSPVIGWITGNTYEHVDEHIGWMRTLLAETSGGAATA